MWIVHVDVHVQRGQEQAFLEATAVNAQASVTHEPGVVRFDVLEDREDASRFLLVEVYRDPQAAADHKQTSHYQHWRDTVAPMMARPRSRRLFVNRVPDDEHFG